jgi:hypothetical protein
MHQHAENDPGFAAAILVYLASSEEKTWMPRPNARKAVFRPRFHRLIAVFCGRGKKDGPILA